MMDEEKKLYILLRQHIIADSRTYNRLTFLTIEQIQRSLKDSKLNKVSQGSGVCQEAIKNVFKYPLKTQSKTLRKLTEYIYKRNNVI